jgi:hypothetical protein
MMGTIVKSIGTNNRDFSTMQAWADSLPADLVADGNSYVGECYNDSEFNVKVVIANRTTSATRTITLRAAAGHSFRDHADVNNSRLWYDQTKGVGVRYSNGAYGETAILSSAQYTYIEGIQVWVTGNPSRAVGLAANSGIRGCLLISRPNSNVNSSSGSVAHVGNGAGNFIYNSLVVLNSASGGCAVRCGYGANVINCTLVRPSNLTAAGIGIHVEGGVNTVRNTATFNFSQDASGASTNFSATSGYNATDKATSYVGSNNLLSQVYANQFVDASVVTAPDYRLKAGSTLINAGTNASSVTGNTTSINRRERGTWDIGAWEAAEPATTLLLNAPTIGAVNQASSNFIVAPNGDLAGPVVVTPSDNGGGGTFTPATVTLTTANPSAAFTYTPTTLGDKSITLTNDGGLTNPVEAKIYKSAAAATAVAWVSAPAVARAGVISNEFTVEANGVLSSNVTVTPDDAGAGGTFTPASVTLNASTLTATFKYTATAKGMVSVGLTANQGLASPADVIVNVRGPIVVSPTVSSPGIVVKTIGTGKDFENLKTFGAWLDTQDLVSQQVSVIGEVYNDTTMTGATWITIGAYNNTYNATVRPVPGLGVADLDPDDALDYGTEGIEITIDASSYRFGKGVTVTGFRIFFKETAGNVAMASSGDSVVPSILRRNRIKSQRAGFAFLGGEYQARSIVTDNLFIQEKNAGGFFETWVDTAFERNTMATRATGSISDGALKIGTTGSFTGFVVKNNAFINCGNTPLVNPQRVAAANLLNNFTNMALTTPVAGITANTATAFVRNASNDYRPSVNSPLVGAADDSAIDVRDLRNIARGGDPDVGAIQGAVVAALTLVTITTTAVDGQEVTISGTTMFDPTSGTISLVPADTDPDGAQLVGPITVTLTPGQFTAKFLGTPPGNYKIPVITMINAGGVSSVVNGGEAISILGVVASIFDGEVSQGSGGPPVVTIKSTGFDNKTFSGFGVVDIQGDESCTLQAYIDPIGGGASIGPVPVNRVGSTWGVQFATTSGKFTMRIVSTANGQTATVTSTAKKVLRVVGGGLLPAN